MTNFSAPELDALWALVEPAVMITRTQGRGDCRARVHAQVVKRVKMSGQMEAGNAFTNYPHALYVADVTFQPVYRPSGRFTEQKVYCSAKHKRYGFKIE
ncbi:hypothetical protein PI124_g17954 [Phytophthora idaei]|nr:hypothetical protein PI125_g18623 [Phytophthora idaei]KAG3169987.1 hypothetical protein PI126_g2516 [Phytophthora idaei]KAG3237047.1 hypothetical protein PI124_g17954 [Phytophthora idaei]